MATFKWKISVACENLSSKSGPYCTLMVKSGSQWREVGRTEVIRNSSNPIWTTKFELDYNFGKEEILKFEVQDQDMQLLGSLCVTLGTLVDIPGKVFDCGIEEGLSRRGRFIITTEDPRPVPQNRVKSNFMNYDIDLNFVVAFDFTDPKGKQVEPVARQSRGKSNLSEAVNALGHILEDYNADNLFPAYGFGAAIPPSQEVSYNFSLNQHPTNPECLGVEGIIAAYSDTLAKVQLFGPTFFFPVIEQMVQIVRQQQDKRRYYVLLIVTNGIIEDFKQTKSALAEASDLPLSVIIAGVGDADFSKMVALNAGESWLQSFGCKSSRNVVQFVELSHYLSR
ncbi:hypothetical protein TCAL_16582 [Tigriopus californicus]|uniref:C2 domain-containing protein n=1 Tax=Tigriopus californicus TaxID=6832 RepID=A0A553NDY7_TIGCA|nr:hypothetical protein TCAL_16582 [Tigriopus californicus]